ncbi:MAG TPA: YkgJ family cysteine cluster protein [Thermodesulfobacteriota bacterium]|nr:YkgJ family cysteine cluster protein [Thermodesulfobacteriota bacterium]
MIPFILLLLSQFFCFYTMAEEIFRNYQKLLNKVDEFSSRIIKRYRKHISCGYGCSDCCQQNLNLFPLEYSFLQKGFSRLPEPMQKIVRNRAAQGLGDYTPCVLLNHGACVLYARRPIICRTHGLPLFIKEGDKERRDCCPKNFTSYGLELLPQTDFLYLERLNTILITVNQVFASLTGIESGIRLCLTNLPDNNIIF